MKDRAVSIFEGVIYWAIVVIPFAMAIAPALMNVFFGILVFCFLLRKIIKRERLFMPCGLNKSFLLFVLISAVSIINAVNYQDSFRGLFKLFQYWALFLIMAEEIKDEAQIKKIVFSMVCGVSLLSLDAIWQVRFGRDFIRGNLPVINLGIIRATGSFPDSNVLGVYLSAIAPLVIALAFCTLQIKQKIGFYIASILVLSGIVLSYSRPTILAIYVCLWIIGITRKNRRIISLLIIIILIAPFIAPRSLKNWAKDVEYNPLRFMCNDDRIAVYRNTFQMIKAHPFIGVGVNNYMKNYKKYKELPEYRNVITADFMYGHNNFLHMAGEIGLLGLAIFLWFLYRLFRLNIAAYRKLKTGYLKDISLGLILCLLAFLINGLTESSFYYSRVALIFWYLVGFSLALIKFCDAD
ncbi:O-antigen ligase family protein [bacterium]|nr:MAG: O-antigen ligase family protein [bacterium]